MFSNSVLSSLSTSVADGSKDKRNPDSIKPPCSCQATFPERLLQRRDGDPFPRSGRMDETVAPDVEPYVGDGASAQPEKEQIPGAQCLQGDRKGVAALLGHRAGDRDAHFSIGVMHQTAAIHAPTRGPTKPVGNTHQGAGHLHHGMTVCR